MTLRPAKLLLMLIVALTFVVVGLKLLMHWQTKSRLDDIALALEPFAELDYARIDTDLRGAVTVTGIVLQPLGETESVQIDALRIASDHPWAFMRSAFLRAEGNIPPPSLSYSLQGLRVPLDAAFLQDATDASADPCANTLQFDAPMLRRMGYQELQLDLQGSYLLDEAARTLEVRMEVDQPELQSMRLSARLTDVDAANLARGAASPPSIARVDFSMTVVPAFGRKAMAICATESTLDADAWSERIADQQLEQFSQAGLTLGHGLASSLRDFYRDWGEIRLVMAPGEPVGPLSLMFLSPERLADALGLQLSLNGRPVPDLSFTWDQAAGTGLAGLFAQPGEPGVASEPQGSASTRILVRRSFEAVPASRLGEHLGHRVRIQPVGQPVREGILRAWSPREAEVEQSLHGGKFTAYVPLQQIESAQVWIERPVEPRP